MFKLVSMDLDETLLTTDKKMPKDFKDFVSGCRDRGIIPIVATGREYTTAKRFVGDVDIDLICNNGNLIRNSMDSKTLYVNPISHEDLKKVYNLDKDKSCNLLLHVSGNKDIDVIYQDDGKRFIDDDYISRFSKRTATFKSIDDVSLDVLSIVFTGKNEDLFKLRDVFDSNISDKFNIHLMAMQTRAEYMLEVLQKNGDKFEGLKFYCKSKNIDLKDVVAIGDDSNDKNIIKNCGLGIAMINAIPDVKDVAKLISKKDNNNNGAIEILKEVLWWLYEY